MQNSATYAAWVQAIAAVVSIGVAFYFTWRSNVILQEQLRIQKQLNIRGHEDGKRKSIACSMIIWSRLRVLRALLQGIVIKSEDGIGLFSDNNLYKGVPDDVVLANLPPELCLELYTVFEELSIFHKVVSDAYEEYRDDDLAMGVIRDSYVEPARMHFTSLDVLIEDFKLWLEHVDPSLIHKSRASETTSPPIT